MEGHAGFVMALCHVLFPLQDTSRRCVGHQDVVRVLSCFPFPLLYFLGALDLFLGSFVGFLVFSLPEVEGSLDLRGRVPYIESAH